MDGLDSSIISTSLPQMALSFHVSPPQMSAAITSYLISLAIFIPISGWIADRFGARPGILFGDRLLHAGLGALRAVAEPARAGPEPHRAGIWRRHDDAGRAADPHPHLSQRTS